MRSLCVAALVLLSGCPGLLTEKGNDFPCDFTQPPQVRDAVCARGEVCGPDNLCRAFHYEGPQFEGRAVLPDSSNARAVHPLRLSQPVTLIAGFERAADVLSTRTGGPVGVGTAQGFMRIVEGEVGTPVGTPARYAHVSAVFDGGAFGVLPDGTVETVLPQTPLLFDGTWPVSVAQKPVHGAVGLRSGQDTTVVLRGEMPPLSSGLISKDGTTVAPLEGPGGALFGDGGTTGRLLDVAVVPPPMASEELQAGTMLVGATAGGFVFRGFNKFGVLAPAWSPMHTEAVTVAELTDQAVPGPRVRMMRSTEGRTWAVLADGLLSTWVFSGTPAPSMVRAFNECKVCGAGVPFAFTPLETPQPAVDVLCAQMNPMRLEVHLERVVGAVLTPDQPCITEELVPRFDVTQLALRPAALGGGAVRDESLGVGVALGGRRGQVWVGPALSSVRPLFLDRVPLAGGTFFRPDGGVVPVAVTDLYMASPASVTNGWAVQRASANAANEDLKPRAFVGAAPGWLLTTGGDLSLAAVDPQRPLDVSVQFGPQLVDGRGDPARTASVFAEAIDEFDGGVRSFVITADDSVYFLPAGNLTLSDQPRVSPGLTPVLTPEAATPIRSFTLERTPVFTNGVDRVRGYAVTSRNLYRVELAGTPARWQAVPLSLAPGEPLEVWMDHPRGGLGRVGYRQGSVFTLPGGFELARPNDAGEPSNVLDYENLGGWPMAWSSTGAYAAFWDLRADGRLDNKLDSGVLGVPMVWRKLTLSDGGEPWLEATDGGLRAPPGRLFVQHDQPRLENGRQVDRFTLFLFTPGQVFELATLVRSGSVVSSLP
ncbi:MAG: hypothetical protein K1X89_20730 [Myxococcaceae bacterium]|nr:hypothetical protein [Myxococcaceae bacterium]